MKGLRLGTAIKKMDSPYTKTAKRADRTQKEDEKRKHVIRKAQKKATDFHTNTSKDESETTSNMNSNHVANDEIALEIGECKLNDYNCIRQKNGPTSKCALNEKSAITKVFRKFFHSNKIKDIIRALLKYLVNGLCLGFVIW